MKSKVRAIDTYNLLKVFQKMSKRKQEKVIAEFALQAQREKDLCKQCGRPI